MSTTTHGSRIRANTRAGWFYDGESEVRHSKVPIQETWEALEELVDEGLIRHLGVSNFNSALLMDLLKYARVKPAVLQIGQYAYIAADPCLANAHRRDTPLQRPIARRSIRSIAGPRRDRLQLLRPAGLPRTQDAEGRPCDLALHAARDHADRGRP